MKKVRAEYVMANTDDCVGPSIESALKKVGAEYVMANTEVWWDINQCPIPDDCDPYCVGPSIESALRNSGYAGPLTITAFGDLEHTPRSVLQAISSTGILLKHVPNGTRSLLLAFMDIKPPVTILFISDSHGMECFSRPLSGRHATGGFNILLSYPPGSQTGQILKEVASAEWLWVKGGLIQGCIHEEIRRPVESSPGGFICSTCDCEFSNLEDFTTHLSCKQHEEEELLVSISKIQVKRHKDEEIKELEDEETMRVLKERIVECVRLFAYRRKIIEQEDQMAKIKMEQDMEEHKSGTLANMKMKMEEENEEHESEEENEEHESEEDYEEQESGILAKGTLTSRFMRRPRQIIWRKMEEAKRKSGRFRKTSFTVYQFPCKNTHKDFVMLQGEKSDDAIRS